MGTMSREGGEIVQVQGGHIIRATGRKDRHSKVYTAKGPRDRRVRLSAHTAIQFYDVQDRLGYDRPSKAVDWLMTKAKSAIDKLAHLPPFDPSANVEADPPDLANREQIGQFQVSNPTEESPMGFHGYPHQDLCLSLQSFQNPGLDPGNPNSNQGIFPVGFEAGTSSGGGSWTPENNLGEMGHFSRLLAWNGGYGGSERETLQSSCFHPQPSIRAWDDLPMGSTAPDHQRIPKLEMQQQNQQASMADGFMGFCIPAEDVHGNNLAYHQLNSASSMSTDSSR